MNSSEEELVKFLVCSVCLELLFEPITLPCGYSLCQRCLKLPKPAKNPSYFSIKSYLCPIKKCAKYHQQRNEKVNILLHNALVKLFPTYQKAFCLVKEGEERLERLKNVSHDPDALNLVMDTLNEAIRISNNQIQLPYVMRAKTFSEMGCFSKAMMDVNAAKNINPYNAKGKVIEKFVDWRKKMHDLHENNFADNVTTVLCHSLGGPAKLSESEMAESVNATAAELRAQLLALQNEISQTEFRDIQYLQNTMEDKLKPADMECQICLGDLADPITCPCGHTWCRACIFESLALSKECPMCRSKLPNLGYFLKRPVDHSIQRFLKDFELGNPQKDIPLLNSTTIPIFVCTLMLPNSREGFHIFESRYRVMIKRLMEGKKEFGILLPNQNQNFSSKVSVEYGTVVRIVECVSLLESDLVETSEGFLPRYVIDTHGIYRFKVISTLQNPDGYYDAQIERVDDLEPEDMIEGWNPCNLEEMCNEAKSYFDHMLSTIPECGRAHLEKKFGKMPLDPNDLSFWLAAMLPLSPYTVAELLPMTCVCDRMKRVCEWLRAML